MHSFKSFLCAIIAVAMLMTSASLAEVAGAVAGIEDEQAGSFTTWSHDGRVTLIEGTTVEGTVDGFDAAARVVDGVLDQLGGDSLTRLEPWRTLDDAYGNRYYVFQQMYDNTTVLGGAVKVITDGEGNMLGLTSSIVSELPEAEPSEGINAEEAERLVREHAAQTGHQALTVIDGFTDRMILPLTLEIDMEAEDDEGSRYVWVVYTNNPGSSLARSSDLPYLAHYVTLPGEYLYSLPTIRPGDEAGASGFDASYVFEFMESVDYTGYVDLSTGGEQEISVAVMRDRRTGMYYLGNLERRIVVADCWEFLYGGGRVVLESSPDNLQWDQVGLLSLYNYCRAYDYYRAIGWSGGDGLDTPILILNNYCDIDHKPVDNAAYVGGYLGWQIFLASQANDYSQCLDVLAHEFTHCVTGSVMTYNAYMNDYGAINEAISDIQGKTCQLLADGAEQTSWVMGDEGLQAVRSMSDPHSFNQPEFTWDLYYAPNVKTPTMLNDEGGVHSNSSLLNYLAWMLYEEGGMTPEEGRAFWFTVDCAMVPGTDYPQLAQLLPWALRVAGLERLDASLRHAMEATGLGAEKIPDTFDEERALLTLALPQTEAFDDEQWILYLFSVNVDRLFETAGNIFLSVLAGDYSVLPEFAQRILNAGEEDDEAINALLEELLGGDGDSREPLGLGRLAQELSDWAKDRMEGVFYLAGTNAGQDGHTMRMVCLPGHALPVLIHGVYNQDTDDIDDSGVLIYVGGRWFDVGAIQEEDLEADGELSKEAEAYIDRLVEGILNIRSLNDALSLAFYRIEGGTINELPATGLEEIQPVLGDLLSETDEEDEEFPEPRLSRPKLEEAPAENTDEIPEEATPEVADAA